MGRKVHSLREVERVLMREEGMRRAEEMWRRAEKMDKLKVNSPVNIIIKKYLLIPLRCYR